MNRLNELNIHVPLVKQEFDRTINSIASWRNEYTATMEINLTKDLKRLAEQWEKKAQREAGWSIQKQRICDGSKTKRKAQSDPKEGQEQAF